MKSDDAMWKLRKEIWTIASLDGILSTSYVEGVSISDSPTGTPSGPINEQLIQGIHPPARVKVWESPTRVVKDDVLLSLQPIEKGSLTLTSELEDIQVERHSHKHPLIRTVEGHAYAQIESNLMVLARLGLRMDYEFWSLILDEDYIYFSGLLEEARHMELVDLAFHTWRTTTILAFRFGG